MMDFNKLIFSTILAIVLFSGIVSADVLYDSIVSDANAQGVPCVTVIGPGADTYLVAWTDDTDGDVKYSVFTPTNGTWSAPASVDGGAGASDIALATNENGTVLIGMFAGGILNANFYTGGAWGAAPGPWPTLNGPEIDATYDSDHDAFTIIVADPIVPNFEAFTYTVANGWQNQTVILADTIMANPSVTYDPVIGQLVTTYKDIMSDTAYAFLTTQWSALIGEYGDGAGNDWGVPVEIAGTALMASPGKMAINPTTGNGAYSYEDSLNTVYITDYTAGAFAVAGTQISAENPLNNSINIAYYGENDDDGAVWWKEGVPPFSLKFNQLDIAGDPAGGAQTAMDGLFFTIEGVGKTTVNNTAAGQKTTLTTVIATVDGLTNGPFLVPIDPNAFTPANSAVSAGVPGETTATITWTTDIPTGNATITYEDIIPPTDEEDETDTTGHKSHSVDLADLTAGTDYYYSITQQVWGKQTPDTDNNGDSYYEFTTAGGGTPGGGSGAAPGMELVGLAIVAVVGLAVFLTIRKR